MAMTMAKILFYVDQAVTARSQYLKCGPQTCLQLPGLFFWRGIQEEVHSTTYSKLFVWKRTIIFFFRLNLLF